LSYFPGIRVLYHEHDSPSSDASSDFIGFIMRCRTALARRAKLCVLPNEYRAEQFKTQTSPRATVMTVWNCPRREEVAEARPAGSERGIWVLYHGSITKERLPLAVVDALSELPEFVKLRIIGYETIGSRGYLDQVREYGRKLGVLHRLEFAGTLAFRSQLLDYCRQSDIGLALMPKDSTDLNMQAMTGASNKAFDYLASGLALIVSDLPDWRGMFVEPGYGVACEPRERASITAALRELINDPGRMRAQGERGRQRIKLEWNYERQFEPVLMAIEA
jgi:glycosyltransferase involved in cell wall biosynthesis